MREVHFGYDNSLNPTGSFEGMSANSNGDIWESEYIGILSKDDQHYLVSRVTVDNPLDKPRKGEIDVRRAVPETYIDHSGSLFVDQQKDNICMYLEQLLSSDIAKDAVNKGHNITDICVNYGFYNNNLAFNDLVNRGTILATSIRHDVFEEKRQLLAMSKNESLISLQRKLQAAYAKINEYENENENFNNKSY